MADKAETKELKELKAKYFHALHVGTPQNKPWGGLSEPERKEVQDDYNKKLAASKL